MVPEVEGRGKRIPLEIIHYKQNLRRQGVLSVDSGRTCLWRPEDNL